MEPLQDPGLSHYVTISLAPVVGDQQVLVVHDVLKVEGILSAAGNSKGSH